MQTSTHGLTLGGTEVRKEFVPDHEAQAEREWACLGLLAEHAPGLAPRPLRREDGATPVIVMERLPGSPLAARPLTTGQVRALGTALRRLYAVPLEAVRDAGIGERRYGAAALSGIADLNPANVLWDDTRCRLVDFEDGGLTDPAYELADHVEHLGSRLPGVYDPRALVDAVGLDTEGRARVTAYRPLFGAFWLAMLLPGNGGWHRNPPGTTEAQARHFIALAARD